MVLNSGLLYESPVLVSYDLRSELVICCKKKDFVFIGNSLKGREDDSGER